MCSCKTQGSLKWKTAVDSPLSEIGSMVSLTVGHLHHSLAVQGSETDLKAGGSEEEEEEKNGAGLARTRVCVWWRERVGVGCLERNKTLNWTGIWMKWRILRPPFLHRRFFLSVSYPSTPPPPPPPLPIYSLVFFHGTAQQYRTEGRAVIIKSSDTDVRFTERSYRDFGQQSWITAFVIHGTRKPRRCPWQ